MDDRGKSILLQVAFKGAVEMGKVTEEQVIANYEMLINLHERFNITDTAPAKRNSNGGGRKKSDAVAPEGESFILEGQIYTDFREGKNAPGVNPNFPDFKRESDNKPFWVYNQDGQKVEETQPLVTARDSAIY